MRKTKKLNSEELYNWVGNDHYNTDILASLLLEVLNGTYTIEQMRGDILAYSK